VRVANVTVLAVDDQAVFRRVARSLIAATPGFEQVGEAASGREALKLAAELHPDLVLVDVAMPGLDGIETARQLADVAPEGVVVLISVDEIPASASKAGAVACVRKQDLSTRTLRALWQAHGARARQRTR
jgi:DNA-binding NarL/FixJ family response regulator